MNMVVRVSDDSERVSNRGRYRLAGWASVVAALAFLVQPVSVAFLPFDLESMRDPVELSRYWWAGALQSLEFAVMAGAVLLLVTAVQHAAPPAWPGAMPVLGAVTVVGFVLQSALSAATYSWWLMQDATSVSPDPEARSAILFGTFVVGYAFLGAANLGTAGWLVTLVLTLRRAGMAGRLLTLFSVGVAVLLVLGTVTGFTIPTVLLHLPLWVVLAVTFLRAARAETSVPGR